MNEDRIVASKDFTNAPLCLSGRGVTKVFGLGDKKTIAVNNVDFDFHVGEFVSIVGEPDSPTMETTSTWANSFPSLVSPAPVRPPFPRCCWVC